MKAYRYPAKVEKDGDSYVISFRDVPECNWYTFEKDKVASESAKALGYALEFYFEENRVIPYATKARKDEIYIDLKPSLVSKIILHNVMLKNEVRPADLARRMNVPTSEVARITNPKHQTKIDTMAEAIRASGGSVQLVSV